jgi:hypothetical protein
MSGQSLRNLFPVTSRRLNKVAFVTSALATIRIGPAKSGESCRPTLAIAGVPFTEMPDRYWRLADGADWRRLARRSFPLEGQRSLFISVTAVVGLLAYPILQPAWVMVR